MFSLENFRNTKQIITNTYSFSNQPHLNITAEQQKQGGKFLESIEINKHVDNCNKDTGMEIVQHGIKIKTWKVN